MPAAAQPDNRLTAAASAAADAAAVRDWDSVVDVEFRAGDLRRYRARPNRDLPGLRSERFAQYHEGIRVYGADLTRQTDAGVTTAVFGTLFTGIDVDTTPDLSPAAARGVFDEMAGPVLGSIGAPSLWVFPLRDGGYALAYRGTLPDFRDVFIDADTGETLFAVSRIRHQTIGIGTGLLGDRRKMATESIGGTYRTRDPFRPAEIRTLDMENDGNRFLAALFAWAAGEPLSLRDLAADADNRWEDGTVVDVHAGMGWSYDYLATQHGWAGIDGADGAITAIVHPVDPAPVAAELEQCLATATNPFDECIRLLLLATVIDNAVYIGPLAGESTGLMVFGEPLLFPMPLTALDVVAHEMAHGVTWFTSGLGNTPPPNEPGALNEAFSDIIGVATEFYVQEAGAGPLRADYVMGEDTGLPLRSLRDPQALSNPLTGPYPDHYDNLFRGPEDTGGVHINATILGHAYYLAIEGGVNRTSGLGVTGVGHENRLQIERIFFNAWENLLPAFADHAIAGGALLQSAVDLFGADAAPTLAVRDALDAVGVPVRVGGLNPRAAGSERHNPGDRP